VWYVVYKKVGRSWKPLLNGNHTKLYLSEGEKHGLAHLIEHAKKQGDLRNEFNNCEHSVEVRMKHGLWFPEWTDEQGNKEPLVCGYGYRISLRDVPRRKAGVPRS
jgi:hypothetical protein